MNINPFHRPQNSHQLSPNQAKERIDAGAVLIDVREAEEFSQVRIAGALLIPMSELNRRLSEIPRDQETVLYCRSGNRSGQVVEYLTAQLGYENVANLSGGILAWYRQNLPVDTEPIEATYQSNRYEDIDVVEARQRMQANHVTLVDVREPYEFQAGHLPGARNIPLNSLPQQLEMLKVSEPLLLVCATGNRSGIAANWLMQQGLDQVTNIEGGTMAWLRHGFALER